MLDKDGKYIPKEEDYASLTADENGVPKKCPFYDDPEVLCKSCRMSVAIHKNKEGDIIHACGLITSPDLSFQLNQLLKAVEPMYALAVNALQKKQGPTQKNSEKNIIRTEMKN